MTVLLPDSGTSRPGAGLRSEINFTDHEYVMGRLILAETVCASAIHMVAILEKTRNRFCRVRRAPPLANPEIGKQNDQEVNVGIWCKCSADILPGIIQLIRDDADPDNIFVTKWF